MTDPADTWRPTASRATLEQRAALMSRTRRFFAARGVLEVDTPIVVNAAVTDVHIHSARVHFWGEDPSQSAYRPYFLHTSPEYAMKRLLAAGSGDIFQICHVMRGFERGRLHNPEFTLVEWYRVGFSLDALMSEVDALVRDLLGTDGAGRRSERITYRECFLRELRLDPFEASRDELQQAARKLGFTSLVSPVDDTDRDELLEFLMGAIIGPTLGAGTLTFVHGYPASQAALARLDPADSGSALRFELYCEGVELANGFHELEHDLEERRRAGLPAFAPDEHLLAALEAGLPECSGVALGFDRTLMLATQSKHIDEVLPFPTDRA
jgi:lysyl-tRNA synthetase class 2